MEGTLSLSPLLEEGGGPGMPGMSTLSRGEIELARHLGLGTQPRDARSGSRWMVDGGLAAPNFGTCYLGYCAVCLLLTSTLLMAAAWEALAPRQEARFWRRRLRPWEEAVEAFVGAALCTETLLLLQVMGRKTYFKSRWRRLDAAVACLTMVCGAFFVLRRAAHSARDLVEDIDVPMLALRFALQPFRIFSTASMVIRAHRLNQVACQAVPEPLPPADPRRPCELARPVLTPDLAAQVRELLPCHLRFQEWELLYSPSVHGTSLNTFYRQQAGPNLVLCRDAQGGLLGGFAAEAWRPTAGGYGMPESFVFVVREEKEEKSGKTTGSAISGNPEEETTGAVACTRAAEPPPKLVGQPDGQAAPGTEEGTEEWASGGSTVLAVAAVAQEESSSPRFALQSSPQVAPLVPAVGSVAAEKPKPTVEVFWAVPTPGNLLQWSDAKMFGLGRALVVCDDFLRGSSAECKTFCSQSLSPAGEEFVIRDFECWQIGPST